MMVLFTFFKNKELVKRVFLLIGIVLITSCSSGRQSFEKGDYDRAVFQAVNRLQKEPGNKKALATLKQAYTYAAENHQNRIKESTNSSDIF